MEIINFKKSATRRIGSFYSLKHYPKSDEPKKTIDDPSEEEQKPKKASSDAKKDHYKGKEKS